MYEQDEYLCPSLVDRCIFWGRTNRIAGDWLNIRTNLPVGDGVHALPLTNTTERRAYYRIGVELP